MVKGYEMDKKSFLSEYSNLRVGFVVAYKHRFTYKGVAGGVEFTLSVTAEDRDEMYASESVCSFDYDDIDIYYGGVYLE